MHILLVNRCFYPSRKFGGPLSVMLAVGKRMIQRGHSVTIWCSNLRDPRSKIGQETEIREFEGLKVIYLNSLFNYHWEPFTPEIFSYCRNELENFDLIHLFGYRDMLTTTVSSYARKFNVPYIFEPSGMLYPRGRSQVKKKIYDFVLGKKIVTNAERIIATSLVEKDELVKHPWVNRANLICRRNGIDLSEFKSLPSNGEFRVDMGIEKGISLILFLGRIARVKNLDLLIKAVESLNFLEFKLIFAGPDDKDGTLTELRRKIQRLNLSDKVFFTGPLYGDIKLQALVDADVFVLPSHSENFGIVAAEAIACGTPVVVTETCGVAHYVVGQKLRVGSPESRVKNQGSIRSGENPFKGQGKPSKPYIEGRVGLVTPPRLRALREAIIRILTDSELRNKFEKNIPIVKKELSWEKPVEKMEQIYREIVE